ncbi:hypothetical protein [uncultured Aquimarina sp.]|uniref:hypothetical protein n=1 Tax=uncultured Aquimarina sp. TaxID=575652 RepID=UPI002612E282|nr:hypothetical protein [uncultured Aquimarina sp.]
MYRIKDVTQEELKSIHVPNQEMIERYRGSKLNPLESYQLIKERTEGFTKDDPVAKEADNLLYWLLYPEKKEKEIKQDTGKAPKETSSQKSLDELKLKEKERLRLLELVELELELEIAS